MLGRPRTSATCCVSIGESTTERALTGTDPEIAAQIAEIAAQLAEIGQQLAEIGQRLNDTLKAMPIAAAGGN